MEIPKEKISDFIDRKFLKEIKNDLNKISKNYGYKKNLVSVSYPINDIIAVYGFIKNNPVVKFFDNIEEADNSWFELQDLQEKLFEEK